MSYNIYPTSQYPLQPSDELFFQVPSIPLISDENIIQEDTFPVFPPSANHCDITFKLDKSQTLKASNTSHNNDNHGHRRCNNNKKIIHRDIERHRRQEMNALYASLRSQLPLKYLKGKRSISDHMTQTVCYIKDLEGKIQELGERRDKLKRLSNYKPDDGGGESNLCRSGSVRVSPCWPGLEIVISCCWRDGELPLSRVMRVLAEQGFGLVSCVSTKVKEVSIYTIQTELGRTQASDQGSKDLSLLEHKLMALLQLESPSNTNSFLNICSFMKRLAVPTDN